MKEISQKTKIVALLVAIIMIVGLIVTLTVGFNFDLKYQQAKKIQLYLEKNFEIADIKQITSEVLPNEIRLVLLLKRFQRNKEIT